MRKIKWHEGIGDTIVVIYKNIIHIVSEVRCNIKSNTYIDKKGSIFLETKSNDVTFHTIKKGVYKKEVCTIC